MQQPDVHRFTHSDNALTMLIHTGEAEILRLLWKNGPLKVGAIHRAIAENRPLAYTTACTQCYKLIKKGLVERKGDGTNKGDFLVPVMSERELVATRFAQMMDFIKRDYPGIIDTQNNEPRTIH